MPAAYDPWRDAGDVHVDLGCRVEQIAVAKEHGALASRLHKQGQVTGRGGSRFREAGRCGRRAVVRVAG